MTTLTSVVLPDSTVASRESRLNPVASAVTSYDPGSRARRRCSRPRPRSPACASSPYSLFVITTLALGILAPVASVTKPVMVPVGPAHDYSGCPQFEREEHQDWRFSCTVLRLEPTDGALDDHKKRLKTRVDSRATVPTKKEASLPRLVEPDPTDQFRKTRIAAQWIEVGMHLEQLQNV